MKFRFGFGDTSSELYKKFKKTLILENTKRFILLFSTIAVSQLIILIFELTGFIDWIEGLFYIRLITFLLSIIFTLILYGLNKKKESEKKIKVLSIVQTILHSFVLIYGVVFTFYLFSIGIYSFTVFLFATILVSFTHTKRPYLYNATIILRILLLFIIIGKVYSVPFYYAEEANTVISLSAVIAIGNFLSHSLRWNAFLKEEEIAQMNKKLISISEVDELTGLYNRRKILEEIGEAISRNDRYSEDFCVTMLDLDHFKNINDKYGHNVGDEVLRSYSTYLKDNLRESDVLGRWGGEEFLIIIPNTNKAGAFKLIERIRKKVESHNFDTIGKITFSAGICEFKRSYTDDMSIGYADSALYKSKQTGRNKVSIYASA